MAPFLFEDCDMHKAYKCKNCGQLEGRHSYGGNNCIVRSRTYDTVFTPDPENFTVFPIADPPVPVQDKIDSMFRSLESQRTLR